MAKTYHSKNKEKDSCEKKYREKYILDLCRDYLFIYNLFFLRPFKVTPSLP